MEIHLDFINIGMYYMLMKIDKFYIVEISLLCFIIVGTPIIYRLNDNSQSTATQSDELILLVKTQTYIISPEISKQGNDIALIQFETPNPSGSGNLVAYYFSAGQVQKWILLENAENGQLNYKILNKGAELFAVIAFGEDIAKGGGIYKFDFKSNEPAIELLFIPDNIGYYTIVDNVDIYENKVFMILLGLKQEDRYDVFLDGTNLFEAHHPVSMLDGTDLVFSSSFRELDLPLIKDSILARNATGYYLLNSAYNITSKTLQDRQIKSIFELNDILGIEPVASPKVLTQDGNEFITVSSGGNGSSVSFSIYDQKEKSFISNKISLSSNRYPQIALIDNIVYLLSYQSYPENFVQLHSINTGLENPIWNSTTVAFDEPINEVKFGESNDFTGFVRTVNRKNIGSIYLISEGEISVLAYVSTQNKSNFQFTGSLLAILTLISFKLKRKKN
ncbi:MAG: hypothetical protein HeimC2_42060 [Candidatus Heimdallarchaeota archaeon LC_2]|nr:MAG: hypothetical protein HeimC2_42060 [Candidatus Heimdallarchaeota archaeon LC_2]